MNSEYLTTADAVVTHQQIMTSLQISEATGRAHKNVLRDIKGLLEKGVCELNFELTSTKVALPNGGYRESPMYNLTAKGCLILASGYDPVLREKIIDKLEELTFAENSRREVALRERERHDDGRPSATVQEVEASIKWIEYQRVSLGLGKSSTLGLIQKEGKRLGLPVVSSVSVNSMTYTATELLADWHIDVSTVEFNKAMLHHGMLEERKKGRGKKAKTYKVLTARGLDYGENRMLPNGKGVMWPVYYSKDFWKLCYLVGVVDDEYPF